MKGALAGFLVLAFLGAAATEATPSVTWSVTLPGKDNLDDVLAAARSARRPVLIDFYAEWCAACRLLDRTTYTAPEVIRQADRFVTIRIDVTNEDDATEAMTRRFGVRGLPTMVFVTSRGAVLSSSSLLGLADASTVAGALQNIP